jgi:hypothetical protein
VASYTEYVDAWLTALHVTVMVLPTLDVQAAPAPAGAEGSPDELASPELPLCTAMVHDDAEAAPGSETAEAKAIATNTRVTQRPIAVVLGRS